MRKPQWPTRTSLNSKRVAAKHGYLKAKIAIDRMCVTGEYCGKVLCDLCGNPARDLHHLIVRKGEVAKASKGLQLYIEDPVNLVFLCASCHTGKANSAEAHRDRLIRIQYERFGYSWVVAWVNGFEALSRLKVELPEEV